MPLLLELEPPSHQEHQVHKVCLGFLGATWCSLSLGGSITIRKEKIMKRIAIVLFACLMLAASAFAADGKQVTYKSGDETVSGMLYAPANVKGKLPAIV